MAKIRLAPGAFGNFAAFALGGGGAVTGATADQLWVQVIGWTGMALGFAYLVWGVTINNVHWWKRKPRSVRYGIIPISLDNAIRYVARQSRYGLGLDASDPHFSIWIGDALRSALANGDLRARGRYFHTLKGGIHDPPYHPKKDIEPLFWDKLPIDAWWAINDQKQRVAGALTDSVIPPMSCEHEGFHDVELDRNKVEIIWPKITK